MGYWPKSVKRRRHNWVTELGRKLVLIGCEGHHEIPYSSAPPWVQKRKPPAKLYVLNRPGYEGETAWAPCPHIGSTQVQGFSEDNATIKGARMMEIL